MSNNWILRKDFQLVENLDYLVLFKNNFSQIKVLRITKDGNKLAPRRFRYYKDRHDKSNPTNS